MRGSGPNSEVTTLVKFAGRGETSKIRCLHKLELVGFVEKDFFLKPAPSNLLLSIFQKSAFLPNFVSKTKAPLLQVCLSLSTCCHVSPRACAPPTRICELFGKKTILNRRTTFLFVCLFCFLNALFAYVLFFVCFF